MPEASSWLLTLALVAEAGPPLAAVAVEVAATVPGTAGCGGAGGRRGRRQVRRPAQVTHAGEVWGAAAHTVATVLQAPEGVWWGWGKDGQAWSPQGIHPSPRSTPVSPWQHHQKLLPVPGSWTPWVALSPR